MTDNGSILGPARSAEQLRLHRETPTSLRLALDLHDDITARHLAKRGENSEIYWLARRAVLLQEIENVR